jgi:hypothetical protein
LERSQLFIILRRKIKKKRGGETQENLEAKTQEERLSLISDHLDKLFGWRSNAQSASEKEFIIGLIDHVSRAKFEIERDPEAHKEKFEYYCVNAYVKVW